VTVYLDIFDPGSIGLFGGALGLLGGVLGIIVAFFACLIPVGVIIAVLAGVRASRKKAPTQAGSTSALGQGAGVPDSTSTTKELVARQADVLIQLDSAVSSSQQDLAFAQAEFGNDATAAFAASLDSAKHARQQAFALQHAVENPAPGVGVDVRSSALRIIFVAQSAIADLSSHMAGLDELRDAERDPMPALKRMADSLATTEDNLVSGRKRIATLGISYDPAALGTVSNNVSQAEDFVKSARQAAAAATAAMNGKQPGRAVIYERAAEASLNQAKRVLEQIDGLGESLDKVSGQLASTAAAANQNTLDAQALLASAPAGSNLGQLASQISAVQDAVKVATGTGSRNPVAALALLEAANGPLDSALALAQGRPAIPEVTSGPAVNTPFGPITIRVNTGGDDEWWGQH
jgi:hypothetical protein